MSSLGPKLIIQIPCLNEEQTLPETLRELPDGAFDAVFLDADKERYPEYGAWAAEQVRPGGLLLADNAYFFGRLLEDTPAATAMRRFHERAGDHFDSVCLPTPDGLLVGVRRG